MISYTKILKIVSQLGGIVTIVSGLSVWIGKVLSDKILQKEINKYNIQMARLSTELQREIDNTRLQLKIMEESSIRYSESQFKLYNELWSELYSLGVVADKLWDKANNKNLNSFIKQMKKTENSIKKNALLIETEHLDELFRLIDALKSYQLGKGELINHCYNNQSLPNQNEINDMIKENENFKEQYFIILEQIEQKFRDQIKYCY